MWGKNMNRKGELQTSHISSNLRIWQSYSRVPQILNLLCAWYSWKYGARLGSEPLKFLYSAYLYNTQAASWCPKGKQLHLYRCTARVLLGSRNKKKTWVLHCAKRWLIERHCASNSGGVCGPFLHMIATSLGNRPPVVIPIINHFWLGFTNCFFRFFPLRFRTPQYPKFQPKNLVQCRFSAESIHFGCSIPQKDIVGT